MRDIARSVATGHDRTIIPCATLGEGPPALLLMSWRTNMDEQLNTPHTITFFDTICRYARLTTFDQRGVGASARDVADLSVGSRVADAVRVLDKGDIDACDVIGDNDGCYIAARLAAEHPGRVRRLALWAPFVTGADAHPQQLREFAGLIRRDWPDACRQWAGWQRADESEEEHRLRAAHIASKFSAGTAADYMEWEAGEDVSDILPQIMTPALVIAARRMASRSLGVATLLPNARFEILDANPETGVIGPSVLADAITAFLRED